MQNKEVIGSWSESAPYWEKYRVAIREMFTPVTEALIVDAAIIRGNSVLDVATGTGEPALSIAEFVGPEGKVVGTDVVPEMVEAARRERTRRKIANARFEVCATESLPFTDDAFDGAVSRFGVMFFSSPVECVRDILRVLKPDARLAMAVWYFQERNPFHYLLSEIVDRYVPPPPPEPGGPDMFRYAKPGELRAVFANAGATATSARVFPFVMHASMSTEDFWTLRSEMSEKLRTKLAGLSATQLAALRQEALEAMRPYYRENKMSFPAEVVIVSGAKS